MGISDKITYTLRCGPCNVSESSSAVDHGGTWSASDWSTLGPFRHFDAEISDRPHGVPRVAAASCRQCGKAAAIECE